MSFGGIPFLSMLKARMNWLDQRQVVLSQNVANADTPGFTASDLKPLDFAAVLGGTGKLAVTDPRHIAMPARPGGPFDTALVRDAEASPDGNSVSLEEEMIKVSDTQAQFQAAANLYSKALSMMKTAIGQP